MTAKELNAKLDRVLELTDRVYAILESIDFGDDCDDDFCVMIDNFQSDIVYAFDHMNKEGETE